MADYNSSFTGQQIEDAIGAVDKYGMITVKGSSNLQVFQCTADGSTDDRATIVSAFAAAIADMPCTVEFGPGDYGISGGVEVKPAQGERGLTIKGAGATATRIHFNSTTALSATKYIAIKVIPSVTPTIGVYTEYLNDVVLDGIGFYDSVTSSRAAAADESHAISIQYCNNASIKNCHALDIGDEAFNFTHVRSGRIQDNTTIGTPSYGAAGGAISIQHGCSDIAVTGNNLIGSNTFGTQSTTANSKGIHLEILTTQDIEGIHIANNTIRDFADEAILLNSSVAAGIKNIEIVGNTIDNCDYAIETAGAAGTLSNATIISNIITNIQAIAVNFDTGKSGTTDIVICDNNIDTCVTAAMKLQVTRANLSNNLIKSCPRGIHVFNGDDITVSGGLFDACGGSALEEIEVETGTNISVSGLHITNSGATSASIKGVQDVHDCIIERAYVALTNPGNMIFNATNVTGCTLNGGGIRLLSTSTHGIIANNKISHADTGPANSEVGIIVAAGNDDYVISGNAIDTSGATNNQYCIQIALGANNTLLVGNSLKSTTGGIANTLSDSGTGTIKDFTNVNYTN